MIKGQRKNINILHIHSDYKFVKSSWEYKDVNFHNDILFIGKIEDVKHCKYVEEDNREGLKSVINYSNSYDIVVLYNLTLSKAYIANRINEKLPIIWRFFGTELYGRMSDIVYDEFTKKYLRKFKFVVTIKGLIKKFIFNFNKKYFCFSEREYKNAFKRINYFSCLFYEEYRFLSTRFKLPKFLQLPYWNYSSDVVLGEKKGNKLLIGINPSLYNNHLAIIENLADNKSIDKYLFLNYGSRTQYREYIITLINKMTAFYPITRFLSSEEYIDFYRNLDALVINGHRQMGVGNIFTAFLYGVKVYLNKKNLYYYFLLENLFLVFDIDDLENDIEKKSITLSTDQIIHNHKALKALSEKYSIGQFISTIRDITKGAI